jgi:GNAT superfamily N-acetyltransferase
MRNAGVRFRRRVIPPGASLPASVFVRAVPAHSLEQFCSCDILAGMNIMLFQQTDSSDIRGLHRNTFSRMRLAAFLWQPCQQIESLEKECIKVVAKDGTTTGYAAAYRLDETHFRLNLLVDPHRTRQGIGTLLLNAIEAEVKKQGGTYLQARLLENMEASLTFALAKGFVEVHRMRGVSLAASDFSYHKWTDLGEQLCAQGFAVTTYQAEAKANNNPINKLVELHSHAKEGWLSPDPTWHAPETTDALEVMFSNIVAPERFSIMKFNDTYVAYTSAERKNMVGTAVHPRYRGRGIATYLKAYDLKRCIDDGQEHFESSSANPAMLKVNQRLGYKYNGLTEVRLVKYL